MDEQQGLSYSISTAYSDSGYLSEPAHARERPRAHASSHDEHEVTRQRPPKRSRSYINAAVDRLTEQLVETADAITASRVSTTRRSLGARSVVISVGPQRLSDAARTRRDPPRTSTTRHNQLASSPPAKRARQRNLLICDRLISADDVDDARSEVGDEASEGPTRLVQVPSPRSGKPRTVVYKPPPPASSVHTGAGTIELPSFMRSSEAAARPSGSFSPPPHWLVSTLAVQETRAAMPRATEARGDLELVSSPRADLPVSSSLVPFKAVQEQSDAYSWPACATPPSYPMPYPSALEGRDAPSPLPFSAPGHPASPPVGIGLRFSPARTSTPFYEQQLLREEHALQTPRAAGFPLRNEFQPASSLQPANDRFGHQTLYEAEFDRYTLDSRHQLPPLYFGQPSFAAPPPAYGAGGAAIETPLQMKQSMAKARRAAHLEQAAAELMSTTKPPVSMCAESATLDTAGHALETSLSWLPEPDAPLTSPSPPQRFPTPSSCSSQATTPIQPTLLAISASEQLFDYDAEHRPSLPRIGTSVPHPDTEQPSSLSTAQVGPDNYVENRNTASSKDEGVASGGTDGISPAADFAIYEDSQSEY